jgi:hypothetical protein
MIPQPLPQNNLPLVRASELTQYSFCHRAWWLGTVKGFRPARRDRLARGSQLHRRHADKVRAALRWRRVGLILLGGGTLSLILTFISNF